jgi:phosphoglycerol transferase MdoB-like AlkP superfamily enzyme
MRELIVSISLLLGRLRDRLGNIGSGALLPFLLLVLFVLLQALFNVWTGLTPNYFKREFFGATIGTGLLLFSPALFFRGHVRSVYLLLISLPISATLLAQFLYYSYAQGFLQASALQYAGQAADQRATIMTLLTPHLLYFVAPIGMILFAYRSSITRDTQLQHHSKKQTAVLVLVILTLVSLSYGMLFVRGTFNIKKLARPQATLRDMNNFIFSPNELVKQIGIINYSIRDGIGYAFRRTVLSAEDIQFATNWFTERSAEEHDRQRDFGIAKGRNLILIQVESLEQAVIGEHIDGVEITPHLNALSKKGLYFPNYFTQVGPGNTADAEFVTLNSLYPLSNTVAFIDYAHNSYFALPRVLRDEGYKTVVLHDDVPTFWNRSNIYPSLGYDEVRSKKDFTAEGTPILGHIADREFLQQVITQIKALPSPFMTTVITISSHTPFTLPDTLETIDVPEDVLAEEKARNYVKSIHYVDGALGDFIDALKQEDLYNNALIVIFGDHGSFSGVHKHLGANTTIGDLGGNQVPLIILAPGTGLSEVIQIPGSHLDLAPTILNLLGIERPISYLGQDLLNTDAPVVAHRDPDSQIMNTIMTNTLAYITAADGQFEHGTCLALPGKLALPIESCRSIFEKETAATAASDLLVKGNLLPLLLPSTLR